MNKEVYVISHIDVKDMKTYFKEYALKFKDILHKYQGEVIVSTQECEVLEGERYGNWTVVIKFPSKQHVYDCIQSKEYAPLADVRINKLTHGGNVLMFPAS